MSTEVTGAAAPGIHNDRGNDHLADDDSTIAVVNPQPDKTSAKPTGLHSPPDSNNVDGTDSELSDFDETIADADDVDIDVKLGSPPPATATDTAPSTQPAPAHSAEPDPSRTEQAPTPEKDEDIGEVLPDHWSGTVPVFKPTMHQFKDFKKFMAAVDSYGMKSGIIKIIPPQEWKDSLPDPRNLVKQVRVREPIKQDIMGSNGTYRQVNILHQRSYNLPQWRQLCDQSEHQPPARRGERRANAEKPKPATRTRAGPATNKSSTPATGRGGRGRRGRGGRGGGRGKGRKITTQDDTDAEDRPMTPESPKPVEDKEKGDTVVKSIEQDPGVKVEDDECDEPPTRRVGFSRQAKPKVQSTSARRKYSKREGSAMIDEEAFKDWDFRMDISDYTPERCEELERTYWKTLTYAQPLYGADLMGTLFEESTEMWNLNRLPNLLDVLGTKVPGVNTAYLYLGMWKATFAWHLEDVDLYSINYLHFGAPKQWYSISQADARRFEAAMKSIWPTEAKACDQFLRHKAFLISPSHLLSHFNIKVNKCLAYPGEFVVTYPYGYHSGYNLGYNCAEAVNFALDSWLPMGRIAKKCECAQAQDSVWVDVYEIERKLRGEPTPEYWDSEDEDEEDEDEDEDEDDEMTGLPSPPDSHTVRFKTIGGKRKRPAVRKDKKEKPKKLRLRVKAHVEPPCCLCPNDIPSAEILSTDDGRKAHRLCALYLPETYIETVNEEEIVSNVAGIEKARLELKCLYCRSKRGACFQCSQKKCPRSYHATCAAAAGVFVEEGDVPVFDKDGIEYKEQAFEFSCRFHRTKRGRHLVGDVLDENVRIKEAAAALKKGDICQMQYYRKEIFAGVVVENRRDEQTLLLDIIPNGYETQTAKQNENKRMLTRRSSRVEVEWRWLLLPDPADFKLPKASANALPMPTSRKAKEEINAKRSADEPPRAGDMFVEGVAPGKDFTWSEFHTCDAAECKNSAQAKLDLSQDNQVWHYLGKTSTEAKAQYTEDPRKPQHNPKSSFLDSVPKPLPPPRPQYQHSYSATHPAQARAPATARPEKPYVYKPRKPVDTSIITPFASQNFASNVPETTGIPPLPFGTDPRFNNSGLYYANSLTITSKDAQSQPQPQPQPQPQHHVNALFTPTLPPQQTQSIDPAWLSNPQPNSSSVQATSKAPFIPRQYAASTISSAAAQLANPSGTQCPSAVQQPVAGLSPAPQALQQAVPQHAWQKFSFFQAYHNKEPSRYRTPYALWGGFTNGYEGDLRKHLMKKPDNAAFSNRRLSFNLGGGLQGLTRPSHQYSNSADSSRSSPFSHPRARSLSGAASPASSYASAMSPPLFPTRGHHRTPSMPATPSQPVMAQQQMACSGGQAGHGSASGLPNNLPNGQQGCAFTGAVSPRASVPPISPAGIPSQQPTFLNTSPQHASHVSYAATPHPMDIDSETQESPAQQLKQQLRRISDAKEAPFRMPRSRGHTPRSSLNQLPRLQTPLLPQDQIVKQERRASESLVTTPSQLAANGVAVREFPEMVADSMGLVEKMMLDLRRASMQSQGASVDGTLNGLVGSPPSQ